MEQQFFNRVGHVELYEGNANGTERTISKIYDVDFKFHIEIPFAAIKHYANISILGLTHDTVNQLTTWMNTAQFQNVHKEVRIFAGYEYTGEQMIYDGYIIHAAPTQPPNMWVNLKTLDGYYFNNKTIKFSLNEEMSFKEVCFRASKILGIKFAWDAQDNDGSEIIKNFSVTGSEYDFIKKLSELFNNKYIMYILDGILCVTDKASNNTPKSSDIEYISASTGMVGIPQVEFNYIVVKCFINSNIARRKYIFVESSIIPSCRGLYRILSINYDGHLRGQEWYMTVKATRIWNAINK